jgi:hypothetical protein
MDHESPQDSDNGVSEGLQELSVGDTYEKLRGNLLEQCRSLLQEIEEFEHYLAEQKKDTKVELRHFKNSVKTELSSLQKVRESIMPSASHHL